ncbi:hypothetical protein PF007_g7539 [Phytophthora fragariae]|uniref:Uncharacterized protein n=1 Tax=Phytophthora fragariae TaxID=53985 RepID=A0A6A3SR69_9STRA|nr:hypothetical protein PF009_g8800 [Phytophthora fragariae]KAE9122179.1 hypothetical protein PF007_g7539 [Phytophthora fragariae]KAE9243222.1 hypothetical protein PF004_g6247 [Phytophthora fragariae]
MKSKPKKARTSTQQEPSHPTRSLRCRELGMSFDYDGDGDFESECPPTTQAEGAPSDPAEGAPSDPLLEVMAAMSSDISDDGSDDILGSEA